MQKNKAETSLVSTGVDFIIWDKDNLFGHIFMILFVRKFAAIKLT